MLIPLRQFITKYLKNLKIKNIFTNKYENALDIMNWKSSGALDILIADDYMIETKYNFATNEKEFGLVKVDVKEKVVGEITEEKIVPVEKVRYRLVESNEIKRYRYVTEPIYKYIKIGRTKYLTTQYKKKKIPVYKKVRQYYTETEYEYRTIKKPIIKKVQEYKKITYENYIPFMLFEKYKYDTNKAEIEHTLYIKPFYYKFGDVVVTSYKNSLGYREFSTPEEFSQSQQYHEFMEICKKALFGETTQKESLRYFKDFMRRTKKEKRYKSSYSYSEDIIDTVFFRAESTLDNKKVEILTKDEFKKELS